MLYIAALDQFYWIAGSVIGALAGAVIPFDLEGISFALTALFVVLLMEQVKKIKKPGVFVVSACAALLGVYFLPGSLSILGSLALALFLSAFLERRRRRGGRSEQH